MVFGHASICCNPLLVSLLMLLVLLLPKFHITDAQIGVCNGRLGNNLPSYKKTVKLYTSNGIGRMRLYAPNPEALQVLKKSNIELVLDVPNENLQNFADNPESAARWVQDNVKNYSPDVKFRIIAVGNVANLYSAGHLLYVYGAMINIFQAIFIAGLKDQIKISTSISWDLLSNSYLPSNATFQGLAPGLMETIIAFLQETNNPLLVNIYPYFNIYTYFSHIADPDPQDEPVSYALFTAQTTVVKDGPYEYKNLFNAMLDATYSAVEKAGGPNVEIIVSESGWPSAGGTAASPENAEIYYKNLMNHVKGNNGSPKRSGKAIETYLFAMFDENEKSGEESEKHFGLFSPNKQPKYQLSFN